MKFVLMSKPKKVFVDFTWSNICVRVVLSYGWMNLLMLGIYIFDDNYKTKQILVRAMYFRKCVNLNIQSLVNKQRCRMRFS